MMSISPSQSSFVSPCARKRSRDESAGPERHPHLWFDDGNIVLLAENVAFKVHRSLLGRHSTVFKDLFELSQPSLSAEEQMDGVPLVQLHDSPHELADLLDVIYNGAKFFRREPEKPSYYLIQSLLRLGSKYAIEDLRAEALRHLELALPGDPQLWDAVKKEPPMLCDPSACIAIANLTRELGLDTLHLRALYQCTQLPTHAIVEGVATPHGTTERLASADVIGCMDARSKLAAAKLQVMEDVAWAWHAYPCDWHSHPCTTNRKSLAARRHSSLWKFDADPLQPPHEWLEGAAQAIAATPLCQRCTEKLKQFIEQRRIMILSKLEDYF